MSTMPRPKELPLDKTARLRYDVVIADKFTRSKGVSGTVSARLSGEFRSGDVTVSADRPLLLANVNKMIVISSYTDFLVDIRHEGGELQSIKCDGVFIFTGSIEQVVVRSVKDIRVSYNVC